MAQSVKKPIMLVYDIEKEPMLLNAYDLKPKYHHHGNIERPGEIMSWSAIIVGEDDAQIVCKSHRSKREKWNVKKLLQPLWDLMDAAHILIGHYEEDFDEPELFAAFLDHSMQRPFPAKHRDTCKMAKRRFNFPSYSLGYLAKRLKLKNQKLDSGMDMDNVRACRRGDLDAWNKLETYNKGDVLCTRDLYHKLAPFDPQINFTIYGDDEEVEQRCECESTSFIKDGYAYVNLGKFHRYRCRNCGAPARGRKNLIEKIKKSKLWLPLK